MNRRLFTLIMLCSLLISSCTAPYVNPPYSAITSEAGKAGAINGMAVGAIAGLPAESVALGTGVGAVAGIGFGSYLVSTPRILEILRNDGVQVVQVGNSLRVIIPADRLFLPGSTIIEPSGYATLDDVAMFLIRYGNVFLTVYAFSDAVYDQETALKITAKQARQVSGYLWSKGRPFYNLQAIGKGNRNPVASNGNPRGSFYNRRIEIRMPVLPPQFRFVKGILQDLDLN